MTALYSILGIVAAILISPLFMRKTHCAQSEIVIDVPVRKAFDFLRAIGNHDQFNKWAKRGKRVEESKGEDGTVGFIYAWKGDKDAGEGEKEIKGIVEDKSIEIEFRFVKPLAVRSDFVIVTEAISASQTKVTWTNSSTLPYPLNIMVPFVEKSLAKDMGESLAALKKHLENS